MFGKSGEIKFKYFDQNVLGNSLSLHERLSDMLAHYFFTEDFFILSYRKKIFCLNEIKLAQKCNLNFWQFSYLQKGPRGLM